MRCFRTVGRGREGSQGQRPGTILLVMQVENEEQANGGEKKQARMQAGPRGE